MNEYLHPGIHPDVESLSAFVEGVLPEHERLACFAHFAECSRCREIVYLAQESVAEEVDMPAPVAKEPVRMWKRWFAPIPALSAAAVACVLVVSIALYRQYRPAAPAPELTASIRPPAEAAPIREIPKQPLASDSAPAKNTRRAQAPVNRAPIPAALPAATAEMARVAPPPPPVLPAAPPPAASAPVIVNGVPDATVLAGIAGTVTDPAGAGIPKAQINLVDTAGSVVTSTSDARGQFNVAGLAPGRYRLNILSPGFKQASKQIDLQPQEVAKADSILEIGAATESVIVNAESSLLKTESGEVAHTAATPVGALPVLPANRSRIGAANALPDKLPPATTAAKGKLMLRTDSAGGLFLSKNAGKSWKAVKGPWQGNVVRLGTMPDPSHAANALFQLTTDSASVWLSRDGNHWYQAPAQRR